MPEIHNKMEFVLAQPIFKTFVRLESEFEDRLNGRGEIVSTCVGTHQVDYERQADRIRIVYVYWNCDHRLASIRFTHGYMDAVHGFVAAKKDDGVTFNGKGFVAAGFGDGITEEEAINALANFFGWRGKVESLTTA